MNNDIFHASLEALLEHGCPAELATEASMIVANDDPEQDNLGRSEDDQYVINEVLPYLQ